MSEKHREQQELYELEQNNETGRIECGPSSGGVVSASEQVLSTGREVKTNPLASVEELTESNLNSIDGILNNGFDEKQQKEVKKPEYTLAQMKNDLAQKKELENSTPTVPAHNKSHSHEIGD